MCEGNKKFTKISMRQHSQTFHFNEFPFKLNTFFLLRCSKREVMGNPALNNQFAVHLPLGRNSIFFQLFV